MHGGTQVALSENLTLAKPDFFPDEINPIFSGM